MRANRSLVLLVVGAMALSPAGVHRASAQSPSAATDSLAYPATLRYGTGLVDIPTAWVSPNNGDIWLTVSGTDLPACADPCTLNFSDRWNTNFTIETHWMQRFSVGFSLYSNNPDWGFFGQVIAVKQDPTSWKPTVAVGFRNLGPYTHEERLLIGHDVIIDSTGGTTPVDPLWAKGFKTAPTFYAVATKDWKSGKTGTFGASLGFGTGLFSDDGGLGKAYNDKGTLVKGLFLGARYAFRPSANTSLNFMLENNGWDWNAGVAGAWRGIFLGLYATELEEGGKSPSHGSAYTVYNYTKFNLTLGFSTNAFHVSRGTKERAQVAELEKEQARLQADISNREAKIQTLEEQLRKAQAGDLAEVAKRREALDAQIQEEKEAIRRAEERLEQLQGSQKPAAPPSGGAPPR